MRWSMLNMNGGNRTLEAPEQCMRRNLRGILLQSGHSWGQLIDDV